MSDLLRSDRQFVGYLEAPGVAFKRRRTVYSQPGASPKQLDFQMPFSIGFKCHLLRILSPPKPAQITTKLVSEAIFASIGRGAR